MRSYVSLRNEAGVVIKGYVIHEYRHGGSTLVRIDLDGTTSNIEVDLMDFPRQRWTFKV